MCCRPARSGYFVAVIIILSVLASAQQGPGPTKFAFYRSHLLSWDELKVDATSGGRRANLYICLLGKEDAALAGAKWYRQNVYRGADKNENKVYRWTEDIFASTPEGRVYLEYVRETLEASPGSKEAAFVFPNDDSGKALYERLIVGAAEEVRFVPETESLAADFSSGLDDNPRPRRTEEEVRPQEPKPVEPSLEQQIEAALKDAKLPELAQSRDTPNFDFFKNPLFKPGGSAPEAADVARAWKKTLSKSKFQVRSAMLAQMRWAMFVDLWAEVARDHGLQVELIDSGKRNAYRSDLDVTVYAARETRGQLTMKVLIDDFRQRFNERFGYAPESLDITIHDGDIFMPGVRNDGQSVHEYTKQLRGVVKELRLKVTSGGDATYFPGANLDDVQKRGLRDGKVTVLRPEVEVVGRSADGTPLETRFKKPSAKEFQVSEFNSRGGLDVQGERMQGVVPVYDRSGAFSNLAQNLEKIYRNGNDHAAIAKLFNRAMTQGAGAGLVNSFYDIHVSDIPDGNLTPQQAAELVVMLDSPLSDNNAMILQDFRQRNSKPIYKMRWIMRVFGIKADTTSVSKLVMFYDVLDTTAQMEQDKNSGKFSWDDGGARYLKKFFEQAKASWQGLKDTPGDQELVRQEAWREFCDRLMMVMEEAMVKTMRDALRDLTPKGKQINAARFGVKPGTREHAMNAQAAEKLAAQRKMELRLLFDFLNRNPRFAEERFWKNRMEGLREVLIESAPNELREYLKSLADIGEVAMNNYLEGDPSEDVDHKLARHQQEVDRVAKDEGPARKVSTDEMRRDLVRRKVLNTSPAEAPLLLTTLEAFINSLGTSITHEAPTDAHGQPQLDPRTGKPMRPVAGGALVEDVVNNLTTPLMVGSSAVDLMRAYVHGGKRGLTEAAVAASFDYLPMSYGVIGVMFQDFSRGRFVEGTKHLGWIAVIHAVGQLKPGVPPLLLVVNIGTGTIDIVYSYTTHKITEDMLEQAFRSRPVQGKRAQRNPQKDSADFFDGDTPEFPVFWNNSCLEKYGWNRDAGADRAEAEIRFRTTMWKDLIAKGLTPDSPEWNKESNRLLEKYSFDLPFYQRLDHLYECYHDEVQAKVRKGFDEDRVLQSVFNKVIWDWFASQPPGYQLEFNSIFDVGEREGSTRTRMLGQLTATAIHFYKQAEDAKNKRDWQAREQREAILKAAQERGQRADNLQKRLIAAREAKLDTIEQQLKRLYAQSMGNEESETPRVRLQAPNWYVSMTGVLRPQGSQSQQGTPTEQSTQNQPPIAQDDGDLPLVLAAAADLGSHGSNPDDWQHEIQLKLQSVTRERPPGFVASVEEDRWLKETGADGKTRNDVYTIRLQATGIVKDPQGKLLGQSPPATVLGYVIAEVPYFSASVMVSCAGVQTEREGRLIDLGPKQGGKEEMLFVPFEAKVAGKSIRVTADSKDKQVVFENLTAGEYAADCKSLDPNFLDGSKPFRLVDPYTAASLQDPPPPNPWSVWVEMKRKPEPPKQTAQANNPQPPDKPPDDKPKPPDKDPANKKSGGGPDPQAIAECQSLIGRMQQAMATGDLASAAGALREAEQKNCNSLDPGIASSLTNAQGQLQGAIDNTATGVQQSAGACDYEEALRKAEALRAADPNNPALAAINIAQLAQQAAAQRSARDKVSAAQASMQAGDLDAAIAALQQASATPNLPECARGPMVELLGQLQGKQFGALTGQVESATWDCDYNRAVQLVGRITNLRPRTDAINAWLNVNVPKLNDLQNKKKEALALIAKAENLYNQARGATQKSPADWTSASAWLTEAQAALNEADQKAPMCLPERSKIETLRPPIGNLLASAPPPSSDVPGFVSNTGNASGPNNSSPDDAPPPFVSNTSAGTSPPSSQPPGFVDNTTGGTQNSRQPPPRLGGNNPSTDGKTTSSGSGEKPKKPGFWEGLGTAIGIAAVAAQQQANSPPPQQQPPQQTPSNYPAGGTPSRGPTQPPNQGRQPAPTQAAGNTAPTTGSAPLRVKFITGVSCSAADKYTRGLGGVMVAMQGAQQVTTDSGGVARTTVTAGNHAVAVSYAGGSKLSLPDRDVQINSASVVSIRVHPTNDAFPSVDYPPGASLALKAISNPGSMSEYEIGIRMQSPQVCGSGPVCSGGVCEK